MSELVTVIITTYDSGDGRRTVKLAQTIKELIFKLEYDNLHYIVTDDSIPEVHEKNVAFARTAFETNNIPHTIINTNRMGVGFGKNNALKLAFQSSPYVLLMEDDWLLSKKLDLYPHVKTLSEYSDIGMIRYGYLGGDMTAQLTSYGGTTYWKLLHKSGFYVYSGQVSLRSKNWYDRVGYHVEGIQAGKEEEELCHRYNDMQDVPVILWPAEFGVTINAGPFVNIGLDNSTNAVEIT